MSDWEILGIAPTDDLREIKRAYSRAVRIYHPEKDPAGFQRLRAAYENILKSLESPRKRVLFADIPTDDTPEVPASPVPPETTGTRSPFPEKDGSPNELATPDDAASPRWSPLPEQGTPPSLGKTEASAPIPAPPSSPQAPVEPPSDPLEELKTAWEEFWNRVDRRGAPAAWRAFLARPEFWDLRTKHEFGWHLLTFLQEEFLENHLRAIPRQAWLLLDRTFDWHARELELAKLLDEDFLDQLMYQIRAAAQAIEPGAYPQAREPRPKADPIPLPEHRSDDTYETSRSSGRHWIWPLAMVIMYFLRFAFQSSEHDNPSNRYVPSDPSTFQSGYRLDPADRPTVAQQVEAQRQADSVVRGLMEEARERNGSAVSEPRRQLGNWSDETGGLLRGYCGDPDLDPLDCPEETRKGIVFNSRGGKLELELLVGGLGTNTVTTSQTRCQKLRLCQRKGKPRQVVALLSLAQPCNTKPDKVWEIRGKRLAEIPASQAVCSEEPRCFMESVCRE